MKSSRIATVVVLAGMGGFLYYSCKPIWDFEFLERRARNAVSASELQSWATNLLAQHRQAGHLKGPALRASGFPMPLRKVAPQIGPDVDVRVPDDTNLPPYVQISWGQRISRLQGVFCRPDELCHGAVRPGLATRRLLFLLALKTPPDDALKVEGSILKL